MKKVLIFLLSLALCALALSDGKNAVKGNAGSRKALRADSKASAVIAPTLKSAIPFKLDLGKDAKALDEVKMKRILKQLPYVNALTFEGAAAIPMDSLYWYSNEYTQHGFDAPEFYVHDMGDHDEFGLIAPINNFNCFGHWSVDITGLSDPGGYLTRILVLEIGVAVEDWSVGGDLPRSSYPTLRMRYNTTDFDHAAAKEIASSTSISDHFPYPGEIHYYYLVIDLEGYMNSSDYFFSFDLIHFDTNNSPDIELIITELNVVLFNDAP